MSDSLRRHRLACQGPMSMGFSRQGYWSGLPFSSPGDLPDLGIEPRSPAMEADSLPTELKSLSCVQLFCNPMDCSPTRLLCPRDFPAIILEWVAVPFSRGIFLTQGSNLGLPLWRQIPYYQNHQESPNLIRIPSFFNCFGPKFAPLNFGGYIRHTLCVSLVFLSLKNWFSVYMLVPPDFFLLVFSNFI